MIIIYRGAHCPLCIQYLKELESLYGQYSQNDIEVIAISADPLGKARQQVKNSNLSFRVGCELSREQMTQLGVFISTPLTAEDMQNPYSEPALLVINPEGNLQIIEYSNAPYLRADLGSLLRSLKYIKQPGHKRHDNLGGRFYPVRGTTPEK